MLIELRGYVKLITLEEIELEEMDLGTISRKDPPKWGWRLIGVDEEEVYMLYQFAKDKTLVEFYDRRKMVVAEPFKDVFAKVDEARAQLKPDQETEEEEENNQESENFNKEDED